MCYYGKINSKLPIFRVKSVKIYTGQKIYTDGVSRVSDNYQVWVRYSRATIQRTRIGLEYNPRDKAKKLDSVLKKSPENQRCFSRRVFLQIKVKLSLVQEMERI